MGLERKAFRTVYRLIRDGQIDEKEAFNLTESIFNITYQYVPVPTPINTEEEESPEIQTPVEVQGFAPLK